jgi:dTDP-4-amino-4,6-dideoxygalactose transaminase
MVVSESSDLIDEINLRKAFGVNSQFNQRKVPGVYDVTAFGLNYRMQELSAAVGFAQMELIQSHLGARRRNAEILKLELHDVADRLEILGSDNIEGRSYYCLIGLLKGGDRESRAKNMIQLKDQGIETSVYYPQPIQKLSAYSERWGFEQSDYEKSQLIADTSIAFPIGPHLNDADISKMVDVIKRVL